MSTWHLSIGNIDPPLGKSRAASDKDIVHGPQKVGLVIVLIIKFLGDLGQVTYPSQFTQILDSLIYKAGGTSSFPTVVLKCDITHNCHPAQPTMSAACMNRACVSLCPCCVCAHACMHGKHTRVYVSSHPCSWYTSRTTD